MYWDLREKLDQALGAEKGRIPGTHPIWRPTYDWVEASAKRRNENLRACGFPQLMDTRTAAKTVIQQIKLLCSEGQLSTADEILKKAKNLIDELLGSLRQKLKQRALAECQRLEQEIVWFEASLHETFIDPQPFYPIVRQMWPNLELRYNDALTALDRYLTIEGRIHARKWGLPLDYVGDAVNRTLEIVWTRHRYGEVEGGADHTLNLGRSILLGRRSSPSTGDLPPFPPMLKKTAWADRTSSAKSFLLSVDDLKDPASLAMKLRNSQDPLSRHLREQLSEVLNKYDGSNLVDEINRLIKGPSLFDEQRFKGIGLTQETQRLIEQNPKGKALICLNRWLLEEAYPNEIANSRPLLGKEEDEPRVDPGILLIITAKKLIPRWDRELERRVARFDQERAKRLMLKALRLYLRRELYYSIDDMGKSKQFREILKKLIESLANLRLQEEELVNRRLLDNLRLEREKQLDQAIRALSIDELVAGTNFHGFDARLYREQKGKGKKFVLHKDASWFLQEMLGETQNTVSQQLNRVIPILDKIRERLGLDPFGIKEKAAR